MNRNILKLLGIVLFASVMLSACTKDEQLDVKQQVKVVDQGLVSEPAIIDGESIMFQINKNRTKGAVIDETGFWDNQISTINDDEGNTYKVLRVQKPGTNRYFWIMIQNFKRSATSGSWIYGNNPANLTTHGRLYNYTTADNLKTKVKMYLPMYNNDGTEYKVNGNTVMTWRTGHLPNMDEINALLETTSIGNLPSIGTTVWQGSLFYYDAFLGGDIQYTGTADATLSGWRDRIEIAPGNTEFNHLHLWGRFWSSISEPGFTTTHHYPFEIKDESTDYVAYINALHNNGFGFAVRYVIDPYYRP